MPNLLLTAETISNADWSSVQTALENQINVGTVVGVLAVCATAAVGLVFMWWGVRKLTRVIMAAFKKGKVSL